MRDSKKARLSDGLDTLLGTSSDIARVHRPERGNQPLIIGVCRTRVQREAWLANSDLCNDTTFPELKRAANFEDSKEELEFWSWPAFCAKILKPVRLWERVRV